MPYPTATPESQGLDSSRLAKLTAWQEQMVADGKVRSFNASSCVSFVDQNAQPHRWAPGRPTVLATSLVPAVV